MINELKKYPKTFKKFEEYLGKFYFNSLYVGEFHISNMELNFDCYCGESLEIPIPEQFLIGCLMEFINYEYMHLACLRWKKTDSMGLEALNSFMASKELLIIAFKIMEEQE